MPADPSSSAPRSSARANDVRAPVLDRPGVVAPVLDDIDRILLAELSADARQPNNALAAKAGIAPSTCLGRIRALRESGVVRGFHADIDPSLAGRPLQAMIAVRMHGHARARLEAFMRHLAGLPGVLNVFLLGGGHDFFVHVAAAGTDGLNAFVIEHLSSNPDVALTETNLIFQHARAVRWT
ncbi:Lrp/AsnC family transcriptional regulator [Nocardioides sp. AN3]